MDRDRLQQRDISSLEMLKQIQEEVMGVDIELSTVQADDTNKIHLDEKRGKRIDNKEMYEMFAYKFVTTIEVLQQKIEKLEDRLEHLEEEEVSVKERLFELQKEKEDLYQKMERLIEIKDRLDQWVIFLYKPDII